jgi:hypothetical protein
MILGTEGSLWEFLDEVQYDIPVGNNTVKTLKIVEKVNAKDEYLQLHTRGGLKWMSNDTEIVLSLVDGNLREPTEVWTRPCDPARYLSEIQDIKYKQRENQRRQNQTYAGIRHPHTRSIESGRQVRIP